MHELSAQVCMLCMRTVRIAVARAGRVNCDCGNKKGHSWQHANPHSLVCKFKSRGGSPEMNSKRKAESEVLKTHGAFRPSSTRQMDAAQSTSH